jgi:hypothetical protein
VDTYFQGEKSGSLLFVAIGIIAIVTALLIFRSGRFQRGLAIPLILVGLVQTAIGAGVYLRTDNQVTELKKVLQADPHVYKAQELIRMQRVNRSFHVIKKLEIALLLTGSILIFCFPRKKSLLFRNRTRPRDPMFYLITDGFLCGTKG